MAIFARLAVVAGFIGAISCNVDRSCDGIIPKNRMQFCCDGIIYYDPNFMYSCQNGKVVRMGRPGVTIAQPAPTTPRMPLWNVFAPVRQPVPSVTAPQSSGYVLLPNTTPAPPTYYQPASSVTYCNGINLSDLQRVQPSLRCCANSAIYDSSKYYCGPGQSPLPVGGQQQQQQPPHSHHSQSTLPTTFQASSCQDHIYYIDPRILQSYECCGSDIYNKETEFCQQAYRLVYQPTSNFRVQPINPSVVNENNKLDCGSTTYVFASAELAHRYQC